MAEAVSSWRPGTEKSYVGTWKLGAGSLWQLRDRSEIIVRPRRTKKERGRNSGKLGYKTLENYGWVLTYYYLKLRYQMVKLMHIYLNLLYLT